MKVLFKNTTKYTKQNCKDFLQFHGNKYGKRDLAKIIIIGIVIIYMLVINLIHKNWTLFVAIPIVAILIFLISKIKLNFRKLTRPKKVKQFKQEKHEANEKLEIKHNETNKKVMNLISNNKFVTEKEKRNLVKVYSFYFYDNYMKIKNRKSNKKVYYFKFKKVYETEEYFFIYLGEEEPWMLKKDGFVVGTAENFSEFIKKKCPFKYKNEEHEKGEK